MVKISSMVIKVIKVIKVMLVCHSILLCFFNRLMAQYSYSHCHDRNKLID